MGNVEGGDAGLLFATLSQSAGFVVELGGGLLGRGNTGTAIALWLIDCLDGSTFGGGSGAGLMGRFHGRNFLGSNNSA